jgi:hypothetical protein
MHFGVLRKASVGTEAASWVFRTLMSTNFLVKCSLLFEMFCELCGITLAYYTCQLAISRTKISLFMFRTEHVVRPLAHGRSDKVTSGSEALSLSSGRQALFELDERCTQYISYRCTASLAHAGGQPRPRYGIELLSCGAI